LRSFSHLAVAGVGVAATVPRHHATMGDGELDFELLQPRRLHCRVRLGTVVTMVMTSSLVNREPCSGLTDRWGQLTRWVPPVCLSGAVLGVDLVALSKSGRPVFQK
jgi:hypothetical protein